MIRGGMNSRPLSTQQPSKTPLDPQTLTARQYARRERIIQAGLALLLERDVDEIQMRDVADRAGVAVSTVYRYFVSKEHLFAAVFLAWHSSMRSSAPVTSGDEQEAVEWLTRIAHLAIRSFELHPNFYPVLVMMSRSTDVHVRAISRLATQDSERIFAEPLVDLNPEDREAVVSVIGSTLNVSLGNWLAGATSIDAVYATMSRVIRLLRLTPAARV
jgi:AcrR family transcriptional regulator